MKITDQPGRIFAVFVFGPLLILKGINFKDNLLILLGILIIIYDFFWLVNKPSKVINKLSFTFFLFSFSFLSSYLFSTSFLSSIFSCFFLIRFLFRFLFF